MQNPNGPSTREKGAKAEEIAAAHLQKLGYKIIKRNFHFGRVGEIDIVCDDSGILVFVEVKSGQKSSGIHPLEMVNYRKQNSIRKTAEGYLFVNKIVDKPCRFDVVTLVFSGDRYNLEHYENAF